ncbi:MAG: DUF4982 domain-containing protein [Clostridiales bacterium]|nr:DUF4982 domain-containing protein [Clostridiales bacterium]
METVQFNDNWKCWEKGREAKAMQVTIPHDAMLLDKRSADSPGGTNTGWIDAKDYVYEKVFFMPEKQEKEKVVFEFEGVYHKATVYINGKKAAFHDYGYTGFYIDATTCLKYGEENVMRVEVMNSDQPNSRWYTGTGIYRPVWMHRFPEKHIQLNGVRITTLDYKKPKIRVDVKTVGTGPVKIEILSEGEIFYTASGSSTQEIAMDGVSLWSPDHPVLYTCRVTFGDDVQEECFGIRIVECTPEEGFCINGEHILLRGACIHHDNGILGACAYDFAEERKIRILLENGYNAIRSAHNPCSKALLRACDAMGMLVMDEYVDMWYIHKTKYDYATRMSRNYKKDLASIVAKDYNHPSVIMYSSGNEVSETAQKKGIRLCRNLTRCLHHLDGTRPVTCGVNIFFNFLSSMGLGVYSDKKAEDAVSEENHQKKKESVGSEFYNKLAGTLGADFMKFGASLYPCDLRTRGAYAVMDIAGYNYGIRRYKCDLNKYPERLILGSETFCADAWEFWEAAKKNKRIIGDFVWAGMDYLGEVGIGAWEYEDYAQDFNGGLVWLSARAELIDLPGTALAEKKDPRVIFGLDPIGIGVVPVNHTSDSHSPSAWKMTNAIESWSWHGCENKMAQVEVYARAHHVSLFVNKKCVGTKVCPKDCRTIFKTRYHDGKVTAVAYDADNQVIAKTSLRTAGKDTILSVIPEENTVRQEDGLCYVRLQYTDRRGQIKPLVRGEITVEAEGGELLGLGSACPYYPESYLSNKTDTYYGEALAVIRPGNTDKMIVRAHSAYGSGTTEIAIVKSDYHSN